MSSATMTTMDSVVKQLYRDKNYLEVTYQNRPLTAMISKFENFKGRNMPIVLRYANPAGRSATFATAQSTALPSKFEDFLLTRRKDYAVATIDGETADATEGDEASFVEAIATEVDGSLAAVSDSLESTLFRNGTGSIGRAGTVSSASLTLLNINDVVNFELGQSIRSSATDGGTIRTGTEVIAGVDRATGILTSTSVAWTTVTTALVANDWLSVSGDLNAKLHGLDAWIPATAPSSGENFFSVDRSTETRLSGNRFDGSAGTIEEALIDGQSVAAREGGRPDVCFLNNSDFRKLVKSLGPKVNYSKRLAKGADGNDLAHIGFRSVVIDGDFGPIDVVAAPKCQPTVGWMLQMDTWSLNTIGAAPKILKRDGLRILRQATADGYEVRVGLYGNVSCDAPSYNCRITLPS